MDLLRHALSVTLLFKKRVAQVFLFFQISVSSGRGTPESQLQKYSKKVPRAECGRSCSVAPIYGSPGSLRCEGRWSHFVDGSVVVHGRQIFLFLGRKGKERGCILT